MPLPYLNFNRTALYRHIQDWTESMAIREYYASLAND